MTLTRCSRCTCRDGGGRWGVRVGPRPVGCHLGQHDVCGLRDNRGDDTGDGAGEQRHAQRDDGVLIRSRRQGGDDGEHTQAYYVIKAAQEREELQRQGDELDQQIQKSEREIRALEKTLSHLYSKNAGYKASYTPVETSSAQYEQKVLLEEQHRAALAKYRTQRMEQSELEDDLGRLQQQLAELDERRAGAEQHLNQAAEASAAAQEQVAQQGGRLERMRAQVDRLLADHRRASAAMPGVKTPIELEVGLEDSLAKTKLFTSGLAQLARSAADGQFALALEKMLADAGGFARHEAISPPTGTPNPDQIASGHRLFFSLSPTKNEAASHENSIPNGELFVPLSTRKSDEK